MWFNNKDKPSDNRTVKRKVGDEKERLAEDFLLQQGFSLIERNFFCKMGEIDLIMKDQDYLVFIEVRYRDSQEFGGALASITASKQKKLRRTAEFYLIQAFGNTPPPCRFDVIAIEGNKKSETNSEDKIHWINNAF
jgi:putative endonuclease